MTDLSWIVSIVSVIGGLAGVIFGLASYRRNRQHDDAEDGRESGIVLTELGYIKAGVDDLKRKQEKQDDQMIKILSDLTAVQESAKQAHKRIDELVNK